MKKGEKRTTESFFSSFSTVRLAEERALSDPSNFDPMSWTAEGRESDLLENSLDDATAANEGSKSNPITKQPLC